MDITKIKDHIAFTSACYVKEICSDLFQLLQIEYFNFVREYLDGTEFMLTTDALWHLHFFKNDLYKNIVINKGFVGNDNFVNQLKVLPWTRYSDSVILGYQRQFSGISAGLTLTFIGENYTDFFHFGINHKRFQHQAFLEANTDLLVKFCYYFKDVAHDFIKTGERRTNRFIIHENNINHNKPVSHEISENDLALLASKIKHKRYFIETKTGTVLLNRKELTCLKEICLGKSLSNVAEELYLSKRTVEDYLKKLKDKFNVDSKSKLIEKIIRNHAHLIDKNYVS